MDIKTAENLCKDKKPVTYGGHIYYIKEIIIWYDIYRERKTSLVLRDKNGNTSRVEMSKCEVCENENI